MVSLKFVQLLEKMAGTTGLETRGLCRDGGYKYFQRQKSTDGTASHWECITGNVIAYRDVYRADLRES